MVELHLVEPLEMGDEVAFAQAAREAGRSEQPVTLRINSPGGFAHVGIAMHNALRRHIGERLTVHVDGIAFSAASVVAMAGEVIEMADNALMMMHEPFVMATGDRFELAQKIAYLERTADSARKIYADRSGASADQVAAWMRAESYFDPQEAAAAGLADRITPASAVPLNFKPELVRYAPRAETKLSARVCTPERIAALRSLLPT